MFLYLHGNGIGVSYPVVRVVSRVFFSAESIAGAKIRISGCELILIGDVTTVQIRSISMTSADQWRIRSFTVCFLGAETTPHRKKMPKSFCCYCGPKIQTLNLA